MRSHCLSVYDCTRDRAFVCTGTEASAKGRLILDNLTRKQKILLTTENLVVKDYRIYRAGDRILFSASEWSKYQPGLYEQFLYAVTTGRSSAPAQKPVGQSFDNNHYIIPIPKFMQRRICRVWSHRLYPKKIENLIGGTHRQYLRKPPGVSRGM
jgi:hypothetical protein